MNWTRKRIDINNGTDNSLTAFAWVLDGVIAAHVQKPRRGSRVWDVTHVSTGLKIAGGFRCLSAAKRCATLIRVAAGYDSRAMRAWRSTEAWLSAPILLAAMDRRGVWDEITKTKGMTVAQFKGYRTRAGK